MRLLLLAQFFPPDIGGEELHVFNLANTLAGRGHEVAVATQSMSGVPDREVLASGVRIYRFATTAMRLPGVYSGSRAHHPPVPDPLGVRELASIAREERPDIVHAHNWIINSALALRRHAATKPEFGLVLTLHDYSHVCATKRLMRGGVFCQGPKASRCLPCATAHYGPIVGPVTTAATAVMRAWKEHSIDHIISVSRAVAEGNRIPDGPSSSVIPNFVLDSALLPPIDGRALEADGDVPLAVPEEPFVLFVGELSHEKGLHTLLRAYESLGKHRPALLLVGRRTSDTPTRLPNGAEMYMDWPHEHVLAAFRRCLMAALPSVCADACPTTVLEAMASGRPVIASSVGGVVDMIADGESGLLVPPGDATGLTAAMSRLLADGDLRARLGAAAKVRVRAFTASAVAERLEAVYARVAPQHRDTVGAISITPPDEQQPRAEILKDSILHCVPLVRR
jgi:glycosyltransferase involved in cell wall biosynthesis